MMKYKGYLGHVEFDDEAGIFHGEIINTGDVITFEGASVEELRKAFEDSVDDYLAFCAQRGEDPEKPFSGQFLLRLPPDLHRAAATAAAARHMSLNAFAAEALKEKAEEVLA